MSGPADEMLDRQVGRYRIVRHLASGGMAELYIARQEAMGGFEKEVVVKVLQPRYAENPRVVQMFLDEARLAAKLNHQSIVHVYDVAEDGGLKYIAMEYIRGETLTEIVKHGLAAGKYLPLEHAVHVVRQTAAGLAYAHTWREPDGHLLRIVHRDVSPTNILVTMEGQTKIVDFGIARAQDELREEGGVRPGKASYMSPEQVKGAGVDTRSDIFSLGIILYELALGQRLFRGPAESVMKRIVEDKVPPPTAVRRDFPPALELIVMRALEKRPDDRYQSAEEMRVDLEEFLADEGLRTGSRRVALYMKEIFPPAGPVSAPRPRRARACRRRGARTGGRGRRLGCRPARRARPRRLGGAELRPPRAAVAALRGRAARGARARLAQPPPTGAPAAARPPPPREAPTFPRSRSRRAPPRWRPSPSPPLAPPARKSERRGARRAPRRAARRRGSGGPPAPVAPVDHQGHQAKPARPAEDPRETGAKRPVRLAAIVLPSGGCRGVGVRRDEVIRSRSSQPKFETPALDVPGLFLRL